jgi:branched-chain amino acid transport system permease protein
MKLRVALDNVDRVIAFGVLVPAALGPLVFSDYWVSFILTQVFWYAILAMSLIFLSAYGGMVSLAQTALFGISGFVLGNVVLNVAAGNTKGLNLGWNPWLGILLGILFATAFGFLFGALASRSAGIYFLMITLTIAVIANYFFGQVTLLSGFSGVSNIYQRAPGFLGGDVQKHPDRLYYLALVVALVVYALIRYVVKTPFGLALQGIRDDPVKMSSLGYNVPLHRTLAFTFASFVASISGVVFVWWNGHIDPGTINLTAVLNLLTIAVIGGLYRLEGAWVGALAFVIIQDYVRDVNVPLIGGSFNTVIGLIFLAIIVVSPGGLLGMWETGKAWLVRLAGGDQALPQAAAGAEPTAGPAG